MTAQSLATKYRLPELWKQIHASRRLLGAYRDRRRENVREFTGRNWSGAGANYMVPVPYLTLATNILVAYLASRNPQIEVQTRYRSLKPMAEKLKLAANHLFDEINLRKTIRQLLTDAIFGVCIRKTGLAAGPTIELAGEQVPDLQPFCDRVSLDNWVSDMTTERVEEVDFQGDAYWARIEDIKNDENFIASEREKVKPANRKDQTPEGEELTSSLGHSGAGNDGHYHPRARLWNLWLRTEGVILTLVEGQEDLILREMEWKGPRRGPYGQFGFHYVPDNQMHMPPTAIWKDIHLLGGELYSKLAHQAKNQKSLLLFKEGQQKTIREILKAGDMDAIASLDPNSFREVHFNGPDNGNLAMFLTNERLLMKMTGNIEALGGLGQQGDTLGQERIIAQSASMQVRDMESEFYEYCRDIARDLCHHLWYHPYKVIPLVKRIPGLSFEVNTEWRSDAKEGDFIDYNLGILYGSMRARSQEEQFLQVVTFLKTVLAPFWPILEKQGTTFNVPELLRLAADYGQMPQILDIVQVAGGIDVGSPIRTDGKAAPTEIRMPPQAMPAGRGRESTMTEDGQGLQMIQNLMGKMNPNQSAAGSVRAA